MRRRQILAGDGGLRRPQGVRLDKRVQHAQNQRQNYQPLCPPPPLLALRLIRARPLGDIGFVVVAGKEPAFAHGGNLLCRGDIIKTASETINDGSGN